MVRPKLGKLIRTAVIDDAIAASQLHLLRLVPLAWLSTDRETRFERMPTEYGPVTIRFRLAPDRSALHIHYQAAFRAAPEKVLPHVPPVSGLTRVVVNGKAIAAQPNSVVEMP